MDRTLTLELTDGRFCFDAGSDSNGRFDSGCGGPDYFYYADNRANSFTQLSKRARTALEYDISAIQRRPVSSAYLRLHFSQSRDLNQTGTPPPDCELLGYIGDGVVTPSDMLSTKLLSEFTPSPDTCLDLDVSDFIRTLATNGDQYAGFTLRIKDDFLPGVYSEAYFSGELLPEANRNPTTTPKLVITMA